MTIDLNQNGLTYLPSGTVLVSLMLDRTERSRLTKELEAAGYAPVAYQNPTGPTLHFAYSQNPIPWTEDGPTLASNDPFA